MTDPGQNAHNAGQDMLKKAGRYAPTAQNRQAFEYVVVHDPQQVDGLRRLTIDTRLVQADRPGTALKEEKKAGMNRINKAVTGDTSRLTYPLPAVLNFYLYLRQQYIIMVIHIDVYLPSTASRKLQAYRTKKFT